MHMAGKGVEAGQGMKTIGATGRQENGRFEADAEQGRV